MNNSNLDVQKLNLVRIPENVVDTIENNQEVVTCERTQVVAVDQHTLEEAV